MHHPLPEVPKPAPKREGKTPFLGLNVVFGVNVFLNVASLILICFFPFSDAETSMFQTQITTTFAVVISFILDFYLWRGYNWARWVAIVSGILALLLLFSPPEYQSTLPQVEQVMNISGYIWWIGVSVWLLLPNVARHFKSPSGNTPNGINAG